MKRNTIGVGHLLLAAVFLMGLAQLSSWNGPVYAVDATNEASALATHKQDRIIRPLHDGRAIGLKTFCLDRDGNILACVAGAVTDPLSVAANPSVSSQDLKFLQVYSPEGELLKEVGLEFTATAVNQAPDGTIFVAGAGKVARISADGKILATTNAPNMEDSETVRKQAEAAAAKQSAQITAMFDRQLQSVDERISKLREKPEAEWTARDKARLATYEQQKKLFEEQAKQLKESYSRTLNTDYMLEQKMGITALAVTSRDLFLCCHSLEGYGYEVWRLNHDFSEPKKVVSSLNGCCGQCDIQATEKNLILAENTKFKVALLDRDGQPQLSFGERDRKAPQGFGSCCNPMNVRCCDNGDILTAESSIGTIKRFSSTGEFLGVVGKAKIGGGCKHVAVGFDPKLDRYYMMNVDKAHICVLLPKSQVPEMTAEELAAKQAREGLGQQLIGDWSLDGKVAPADKTPRSSGLLSLLFGSDSDDESASENGEVTFTNPSQMATHFSFQSDGSLKTQGSYLNSEDQGWEAKSQDGKTLVISQFNDGVAFYDYRIEFQADDTAIFSMLYDEQVLEKKTFRRVKNP